MESVLIPVLQQVATVVNLIIKVVVIAVIVLMLLRWLLLQVSPFGWPAYQVRRVTDPMVWPLAQSLPMPNSMSIAPLIVVLVTLLGAYFLQQMVQELLESLFILVRGITSGRPLWILGGVLYAAVSTLLLLIVVRIVSSWVPFLRDNKVMWTIYSLTEPIMGPFRQIIPPLGMFDLSPILLMFLLSFVKNAIRSLLLQ
jgi:YggT family protein